ncbi:MAG TPA: hypothetical protein VEH29_06905 [Acidimicrobiales bacterium]|nr:hypothetical protein [Acidimicrobiales bacterium]
MSEEVDNHPVADSLFGPADPDQVQLLEVITQGREIAEGHQWPFFQYVEKTLYDRARLDATEVMLACPRVTFGHGHYGWIRVASGSSSPRPDDQVSLTMAGLAQLPACAPIVEIFLNALEFLVEAERSVRPSPTEVVETAIRSDELLAAFWAKHRITLSVDAIEFIITQVDIEPSTSQCRLRREQPPSPHWVMTLTPGLRRYGGVTTVEEYLERLVDQISPPVPATAVHPSALALPEAIDYLNVVWELRSVGPLFGKLLKAEAAAKLALDCAGRDEFDSRLSALCSILDHVELPGGKKTQLIDLQALMEAKLADEARERTIAAVEDLRALFALRSWRQQGDGSTRAARGMRQLGVSLPTADWRQAWDTVRARCISALNALREEVEAAADVDFRH